MTKPVELKLVQLVATPASGLFGKTKVSKSERLCTIDASEILWFAATDEAGVCDIVFKNGTRERVVASYDDLKLLLRG